MFCQSCGSENSDTGRFCTECGEALGDDASRSDSSANSRREYLETAIGPRNTDYYLSRFERFSTGGGFVSWNWPAFFLSLIWLLYRKMWAYAAAYFVLPSVLYTLAFTILLATTDADIASAGALLFYLALIFVAFPMFANALYYRVVQKRVAKARAWGSDRQRQLRVLASEGGTSNAAFVVVAIMIIPVTGILAAIAIPAYQDYTIRAQVTEGLNLAAVPKVAVAEMILDTGEIPADRVQAGLSGKPEDTSGRYVKSIDVVDGRIDITYGGAANSLIADRKLSITPYLEEIGADDWRVLWRCGHGGVPAEATHEISVHDAGTIQAQYLPSACRP